MTKQQEWLFRSLTSLIFIYGGIKHLSHPDGIFKRIATSTVYLYLQYGEVFKAAILLSGLMMVVGGLALMLGYKSRSAAMLLLSILIPITLTTQLENLNDLGPFFKNVAISGSLLLIIKYKKNENKKHSHHTFPSTL
jgi:putative oxidoreductase